MLMGWATGMAHLDRNSASPGLAWLNVTGVALALLALALYTLIRLGSGLGLGLGLGLG